MLNTDPCLFSILYIVLYGRGVFTAEEKLNQHRSRRKQDDGDHDRFEVFLQVYPKLLFHQFVQVMAQEQHRSNPCNASNNIIEAELFLIHVYNACNYRRKGSDERKETCKNDRAAAMFVVKIL